MDSVKYARLMRRHWKLLVILTVLGALGASALALTGGDDEIDPDEIQVFYAANHILIADGTSSVGSLNQIAFFATVGEVPDRVAEDLDRERADVVKRVQTITDPTLSIITISAADENPDDALLVTNAFADELVDFLEEENQQVFDERVAALEAEVGERNAAVSELDDQINVVDTAIANLQAQIDAGQGPEGGDLPFDEVANLQAEQRLIDVRRQAELGVYQSSLQELDALLTQGVQPGGLETLEVAEPYEISQGEYTQRLRAGETGNANYIAGEENIPRSTGGGRSVTDSITDNPVILILGGAMAGLLIGALIILVIARLDPRIMSREEAEEYFGLPVIAEIPAISREYRKATDTLVYEEPLSRVAEAYRALRSSLVYVRAFDDPEAPDGAAYLEAAESQPEVVMITSPGAGEGKTTTVANLSAALAEAGYEVLAINCDFRRPRLASFLRGREAPKQVSDTQITGVSMINHVTADGSEGRPADVIAAQRRVVERARGKFDVILLDTAPLLATNDANELLPATDLVLVICQIGRTTKESAESMRDVLERREAPVVGVVLIGSEEATSAKGYYYYAGSSGKGRRGPSGEKGGFKPPDPPKQSRRQRRKARKAESGDGATAVDDAEDPVETLLSSSEASSGNGSDDDSSEGVVSASVDTD